MAHSTNPTNREIADRLSEAARLLEAQEANRFRVAAYRTAAGTVARLSRDVRAILDESGEEGLVALPGIGRSIASAINEMCRTGHWLQLDRLRDGGDPEQLLRRVPGIGPALAHQIHEELGIESLEALELAAHDGRLEAVEGIGTRRAQMVRASVAQLLRRGRPRTRPAAAPLPSVEAILDVDREYREKARSDQLRKIAPRRFNPSGEAWLPVLHTRRGRWEFSALFSNTARAHRLGRNRDWVVIYFHTDSEPEGQCTVVTEHQGPARGSRVVRGREDECRARY